MLCGDKARYEDLAPKEIDKNSACVLAAPVSSNCSNQKRSKAVYHDVTTHRHPKYENQNWFIETNILLNYLGCSDASLFEFTVF